MRHLSTLVAVSYCAACAANEAEPVVVQLHTLDSETNGVQFLEPVTVPGAIGLMPEPSIDRLSKGATKADVFEVVPDEIVDLHDLPSKTQTVEVKSSRRADGVASGISSRAASSVDPAESSKSVAAEISDADAAADDDTAVVLSAGDGDKSVATVQHDSDKSVATVQHDSDKTVAVVQDDSDKTVAVVQDDSDKTVATVPDAAELAVTETVPETVPETSPVPPPTEEAPEETAKKSTLFSRAASRVTAAVEFVRWLTALIQKWFSTAMSLLALAVAVWAWRRLAAPATSCAAPAVIADDKAAVSTATGESHKAGTAADTPDIWVPPQRTVSTAESRSVTFPKEEYMPGVQEGPVPAPPALPARRSSASSSASSSSSGSTSGSGARKAPAVVVQQQQRSPQQQSPLLAKQQVVPGRVSVLVPPGAPLHEALHQSQLSESAKSLLTGTATTSPLLKGRSASSSSSARSARRSSLQELLEQDAAQQKHAERSVPAPVTAPVATVVSNNTTTTAASVPEAVVVAAPAAVAAPVATIVAEPAAAAVVPAAAVTVQGKSAIASDQAAIVSPNSVSSSESKSSTTNRLVPPPEDIDYGVRSPPSLAAPTWAGQLKASHLYTIIYCSCCFHT
jgi:hypothetical protein